MSQTWVAGYEVAFTIGGDSVIALTAEDVSIQKGARAIEKRLLGNEDVLAGAGQSEGSFSSSGVGTQEALPGLFDLADPTNADVAIVVTFWGSGDTASFQAVITDVTVDASADGDVNWSISATIDGAITYNDVP